MVRFFLLTAMLAVPVSATTGAPVAATEISGDWSGRIGLPKGGDTNMTVTLKQGAAGTAAIGAPADCGIKLEFITFDAESDKYVYGVTSNAPSGFCQRYRFGTFTVKPDDAVCAIDFELSPHPDLDEDSKMVSGHLNCN